MKNNTAVKIASLFGGVLLFQVYCITGVQCIFKKITGIECPGCGMTRALIACLHLNFKEAFGFHPMVFSLPILFLYFWKDGELFKNKRVNIAILAVIIFGFILCYVIKLINMY